MAARCGSASERPVHEPRSLSGAPDVIASPPSSLGEPADGLVGVADRRRCARRCACRRAGRSCGCGRRTRGRSPAASASVSSRARYMATWRGQATALARLRGERARPARRRTPRRCCSWISSTERRARPQVGIEAGEDLLGELGGDRPAGERAEGDDADQRALERADVGVDALGDQLERAGVDAARRRPGARACAGSSGAWRSRAGGRRTRGRPRSARAAGPRARRGRAAGGRR